MSIYTELTIELKDQIIADLKQSLAEKDRLIERFVKALKNIIECEEQWTRHDMVREAKQALKEREGRDDNRIN